MNKSSEKLQTQLIELSGAVNSFTSEKVQLKIIEKILDDLTYHNNQPAPEEPQATAHSHKKPGPTRILKQLLGTAYFQSPRTLPEITIHINQLTSNSFYTYQISGVLLGLVRLQKLSRTTDSNTNNYLYLSRVNS